MRIWDWKFVMDDVWDFETWMVEIEDFGLKLMINDVEKF